MKQRPDWSKIWGVSVSLMGLMGLQGCALGPDFVRPAAPAIQRYTPAAPSAPLSAAGHTQRLVPSAPVPAHWWTLFGSPALNAALDQALSHNQTVAAALANLQQSQAQLRAGEGVFFPSVTAGLDAERAHSAPLLQGSAVPGTTFNVVSLSGTISYPLDIFGGARRAVEALRAQVDYQRYINQATYLTLTGNVVNTTITRAAYAAQVQATQEIVALETQQLRSIQAQVAAGTAPYSSELSQLSLLASNQAALAALAQKLNQTDHLLALLEGLTPADAQALDVKLDSLVLPSDLPLSLPSELVRQRPDILAAEAQLHAASANIGVATAAMFPSLSLSATDGTAAPRLAQLFSPGGRYWDLGSGLTAPLFNGGSLSAQRQAALHAYAAQQANYRQTVLSAFTQVADVLTALEHDAQALQAQTQAQAAAKQALDLLQDNYRAGVAAYIDVLTADQQYHSARIAYLQALAQRYQDTVALYCALGGGWWSLAQTPAVRTQP